MAVLHPIGTSVPSCRIEQAESARVAARLMGLTDRRERSLASLYAQSGVRSRQAVVAENGAGALFDADAGDGPGTAERVERFTQAAPAMAEAACRDALDRSGTRAGRITHLVVVSCTGFHAPGVDVELIRRLGLPGSTQRTMVGYMGCHGAINGLRVAAALADANPDAAVLVCCVETCSVHFQYRPTGGAVTANALFSDGAAACVVSSHGDGPRLATFGSTIFPGTEAEMGWRVGNHGFVMSLSARVPRILREHAGPWLDAWLGASGLTRADVASWAVHPGGPRIIDGVRGALGLPAEAVSDAAAVLAEHGNMSSPTVLFVVRRMLERGAGLPMVALAFGPGLAGEALRLDPP